jgi:predicted nucleotide-binding protein
MPTTRIFLGSSAAARSQAKAFARRFESPTVTFLPWWEAFVAGRTLLEDLDEIKDRVDAAVMLMSPESETTIRGNPVQIPNLNVLFELGFFAGHLGRRRVAMIRYGDFYLPSDLGGYIHIAGSSVFRRGGVVKVGKRSAGDFGRWVAQV